MGKKYSLTFTPEEAQKFSLIPTFGVPVNTLKQYINLSADERKKYDQPGIPMTDTTSNNELSNWVYEARIVTRNLHDKELRFAIKGDSHEKYPEVQKVIDVLQKQAVNKFSLITALNQSK
jgi:biopolymer transport protein ExbD